MPLLFQTDALKPVPRNDLRRIKRKIDWLWDNREAVIHEALSGDLVGYYKYRVGRYRILYNYDPDADDMVIRRVDGRDRIYDTRSR